ncbi:MAG: 3-dehydroquinate synthase II [Nitrososphaerota archaeon]
MKKVILDLRSWDENLYERAVSMGFDNFIAPSEKQLDETESRTFYIPSGDVFIAVSGGRRWQVPRVFINSPSEIERIIALARSGASEILVSTSDWRIIPLENLIAMKAGMSTSVLAEAESPNDVELLMGILEKGVDGVSVKVRSEADLRLLRDVVRAPTNVSLQHAMVEEVRDVGIGDRACIDTVSVLKLGEGLLVGSMASMFFLIHNESIGSSFTSPRPFRVNAGAIHSYILMPDGTTKYLSELSSGDRVMVVDQEGRTRLTSVGRVKIEKRPLRLVKVSVEGQTGAVTVQNAETIRFIAGDGKLIPVTELKKGDRILVHVSQQRGRHFGIAVDETVVER